MKVIVTTYPYNSENIEVKAALDELRSTYGIEIKFNHCRRKYTKQEHLEVLQDEKPDIIIAGTESYDAEQLDVCDNLKMISRVGIGLDSVNLEECKRRGIVVTNTPDAPTNAVAELTLSQILSLLRLNHTVDAELRTGNWTRFIGREIGNCCVGVVGNGRIGSSVIEKIQAFSPREIMYVDTDTTKQTHPAHTWSTKQQILQRCDIITLHIPLNKDNKNYIGQRELSLLKEDVVLINTSRGSIINEEELYWFLKNNPLASAAIDVFEKEPYEGKLLELSNILLSPHLGSCTQNSRLLMESRSALAVLNYLQGATLLSEVVA